MRRKQAKAKPESETSQALAQCGIETATTRQTWCIAVMTKHDVRDCGLTKARASELIDLGNKDKAALVRIVHEMEGAKEWARKPKPESKVERLRKACEAAKKAIETSCNPGDALAMLREAMALAD